jgi:hypothetical protein
MVPLLLLLLAACTTDITFKAHSTTSRPHRIPTTLGVYYTTGTLTRVVEYKNSKVKMFRTWRVHVGQALEKDALSRLRPLVDRLVLSDTPYPDQDMDYVLTLDLVRFDFIEARAALELSGLLRGPGNAVLLEDSYPGIGSTQLMGAKLKMQPEQALGETTRDAITAAMSRLVDEVQPYLRPVERP